MISFTQWLICCYCSHAFSFFFFFKQKTAYEMRISDWSSDVCSSDLAAPVGHAGAMAALTRRATSVVELDSVHRFRDTEYGHLTLRLRNASTKEDAFAVARALADGGHLRRAEDRKSVVSGKSVSVRVDLGGRRYLKTIKKEHQT